MNLSRLDSPANSWIYENNPNPKLMKMKIVVMPTNMDSVVRNVLIFRISRLFFAYFIISTMSISINLVTRLLDFVLQLASQE